MWYILYIYYIYILYNYIILYHNPQICCHKNMTAKNNLSDIHTFLYDIFDHESNSITIMNTPNRN